MINSPDISVIVPIYNVEKYLPRCIDSIINQTHKNIEIILVDDGSPDRSGEIADEYAKKDERIKVIHQENRWLGGARNSGLRIANGKYVLFVDSDDYVRLNMCERLLRVVNHNDVDIVMFGETIIDGDSLSDCYYSNIDFNTIFRGDEARDILFSGVISSHSLNSSGTKLYKRTMLIENNIFFDEEIRYAEDYDFCLRLFPHIDSFINIHESLVFYELHSGSIMFSFDDEIVDKLVVLYNKRENFILNNNLINDKYRTDSANLLLNSIINSINKYIGNCSFKRSIYLLKKMVYNNSIINAMEYIDTEGIDLGRIGKLNAELIKKKRYFLLYLVYVFDKTFKSNERR